MAVANAIVITATIPSGKAASRTDGSEFRSRLFFGEVARLLDVFLPTARVRNHRTVSNRLTKVADQIEKRDVASPYRLNRAGKSLVSVFIDSPTFARLPAIKAGISRSRWDALFRKAEHRLSLPMRRISPPASTISFARRCAHRNGCPAETSVFSATEKLACKASL